MLLNILCLLIAALAAYAIHNLSEYLIKRKANRNFRLTFREYHIHHSFFGALAIIIAFVFANGVILFISLGYGLGNIWQHKQTHNRVNEPGMVFISKLKS